MASRRFKFKPKPVISSVARKPKEISDISGHVDKDDSVEPIKSNSNSFGTQFIAESIEKESPGIANEFQITLKNGLAVESHSKTVECNLNIKHNINEFEEEIKENTVSVVPNDISAAEHEKVEGIGNSELEQDDYNFQKNTETDSSLSNTESEKCNQEKPKVATKFGRFRCKPVLSGATPRRKAEEPNQGNTVDIIQSKPVDNCEPVEKVEQCESDVNDVVLLLEPQKVNLTSTDQSNCDILDKETPNSSKTVIVELSKPPLSPVKTSHKTFALKPIPRLSDRRPSLQAIESEEDSNQNKDTADDLKQHKDLLDEEKQIIPKKEQSLSKNKRQPRSQLSTFARMGQDALDKLKDKFGDQSPVKNEMTMLDLIFYNPKSNPMSQKPISVTNSKRKLDLDTKDSSGLVDDILAEQSIDDVEELSNHTMPVPQLKVGPDGQVILDPQSLIIETTDVKKNRENLENSEVVQETEGSYKSYLKKRSKRNEWSPEETLQFYRALNTLGTDFALMASLFPKRTRRDLKLKFKREERVNLHLVDKAVTQPMEFDFKVLEEEMKQDADLIATRAAEKEKLKKEMKEEKEKLKKLKETVIGKKKYRYKSEVFKQFLDEDIGEFRTSKSVKRKKAKRIKVKNIKELINNEHFEDKDRVKRIPKETKLGKIPKRSRSANPVETEVIKPKRRKTENLKEEPCKQIKKTNYNIKNKLKKEENKNKCKKLDYLNENETVPGLFEEPWDLTAAPIPDIEENILGSSQEENESVSIISELGSSFVDEVNNMDSSTDDFVASVESFTQQLESRALPPYSSIAKHKQFEEKNPVHSAILNTRLLTESMQIIDQLTSTSNVGVSDEDLVYIENEGCEEIGDNAETVDSPSLLSEEPLLVKIVPSNSAGENCTYFNVEIQMPFKIRQKQMKFAKVVPVNQQDENKKYDNFIQDKCNAGSNVLHEVTSITSENDDVQNFSNPETVEEIDESKSTKIDFDESDTLKNEVTDLKIPTTSVSLTNKNNNINCINTNFSETSTLLDQEKSYVLNSEGIIRTDNITMFIPRFEIISGDSVDNSSSQERNLVSSGEMNSTDNFIIIEPINETTVEKEQSSDVVYSQLSKDANAEFILGQ